MLEIFNEAVNRSKNIPNRPSNEDLLKLYALYKQATEGDTIGERPVGFDFKAIAKYDAWYSKRSLSKEQAMESYIELVNQLSAG